ncbi:unnamed protein product [Ixodes pacificus]
MLELSPPTLRHTSWRYRTTCAPLEFHHLTDASDRRHRRHPPAAAAPDELTLDGLCQRHESADARPPDRPGASQGRREGGPQARRAQLPPSDVIGY